MQDTSRTPRTTPLMVGLMAGAIAVGAMAMTACSGNDDFRGQFQPGDAAGDTDNNLRSPIPEDIDLAYFLAFNYRPHTNANPGLEEENTVEAAGHLCLHIEQVRDPLDSAWSSLGETQVAAPTKVAGLFGEQELTTSEVHVLVLQGVPTAVAQSIAAADAEASFENLWLPQLSVVTTNPLLRLKSNRAYHTRQSPAPPDQDIEELLFFDVRQTVDGEWNGWSSSDPLVGAFLRDFNTHFVSVVGATNMQDITLFRQRIPITTDCSVHQDIGACTGGPCFWDYDTSECIGLYTVETVWRETLATGPQALLDDAAGKVIHHLRFEFTEAGILRRAVENIVPDNLAPTDPLPTSVTSCNNDTPCVQADVDFGRLDWADAECTF